MVNLAVYWRFHLNFKSKWVLSFLHDLQTWQASVYERQVGFVQLYHYQHYRNFLNIKKTDVLKARIVNFLERNFNQFEVDRLAHHRRHQMTPYLAKLGSWRGSWTNLAAFWLSLARHFVSRVLPSRPRCRQDIVF